MRAHVKRNLIGAIGVLFVLVLLSQCAWFKGKEIEPNLIKPQPVGGYEALRTRIHYPRSLREQGIEGTVTVNAFVSASGLVEETRIGEKLEPELDRIAANAVQRTAFEPATRSGTAVSVWMSIPIIFALSDWEDKASPFDTFEMLVRPDPGYQRFEIEMKASLKSEVALPLRFECLLPVNSDKSWVSTASGTSPYTNIVRDDNGEWLVFEISEQTIAFGFTYGLLGISNDHKFRYNFSLNQTLPEWGLSVIYGSQSVRFSKDPDRLIEQDDGGTRYEYDLESLDAYETRYLEISLLD